MATVGGTVKGLLASILPKKTPNPKGTGQSNTFNPTATDQPIALPGYREHLTDIFSTRQSQDSRALLQTLFQQDPDMSAAVNAYLTAANTTMWYVVKDSNGVISRPGHKALEQLILSLTTRFDYTLPSAFSLQKSIRLICEQFRYMVLLRGGIGAELVFNKQGQPVELRNIDLATIKWVEKSSNVFIPQQFPTHAQQGKDFISLDIPTFFVSTYHQDPTGIYTYSPFVSAINTIAARQQIVNDLYRIMQMTGYPRIDVKVLEEVLRKNAPAAAQTDPAEMKTFVAARLGELRTALSNLRPDQALIHMDSVEVGIMNDKSSAVTLDIEPIITVLNAQNQAALKVMSTIIGRGESGVNTASVEANIFRQNAEEINGPVADILSQALTLALRLQGIDAIVTVGFDGAELRPDIELEPNKLIQQTRLLQLLSSGLIDDDEFHLELFNRIRPDATPELSGTGFFQSAPSVDGSGKPVGTGAPPEPQPNATKKAVTPKDSKAVKSNAVPK